MELVTDWDRMHLSPDEAGFWGRSPARYLTPLVRVSKAERVPLSIFAMGDPNKPDTPAFAVFKLHANSVLPRHSHPCERFEVIVAGSMQAVGPADGGRVLREGDVMLASPNEFYGPYLVGPDGLTVIEYFGAIRGLYDITFQWDGDLSRVNLLSKLNLAKRWLKAGATWLSSLRPADIAKLPTLGGLDTPSATARHFCPTDPSFWGHVPTSRFASLVRASAADGIPMSIFAMGDATDPATPAFAVYSLPANGALARQARSALRFETIASGSLTAVGAGDDGKPRTIGHVTLTQADQMSGPRVAGADGAVVIEFFTRIDALESLSAEVPDGVHHVDLLAETTLPKPAPLVN